MVATHHLHTPHRPRQHSLAGLVRDLARTLAAALALALVVFLALGLARLGAIFPPCSDPPLSAYRPIAVTAAVTMSTARGSSTKGRQPVRGSPPRTRSGPESSQTQIEAEFLSLNTRLDVAERDLDRLRDDYGTVATTAGAAAGVKDRCDEIEEIVGEHHIEVAAATANANSALTSAAIARDEAATAKSTAAVAAREAESAKGAANEAAADAASARQAIEGTKDQAGLAARVTALEAQQATTSDAAARRRPAQSNDDEPKHGGGGKKSNLDANNAARAVLKELMQMDKGDRYYPDWPGSPGEQARPDDWWIDQRGLSGGVAPSDLDDDDDHAEGGANTTSIPKTSLREDGSLKPLRLDFEILTPKSPVTRNVLKIIATTIRAHPDDFGDVAAQSEEQLIKAAAVSLGKIRSETLKRKRDPQGFEARKKRDRDSSRRRDRKFARSRDREDKAEELGLPVWQRNALCPELASEDETDAEATPTNGTVGRSKLPAHRSAEVNEVIGELERMIVRNRASHVVIRTGEVSDHRPKFPLPAKVCRWMVSKAFAEENRRLVEFISRNPDSSGRFGRDEWGSPPVPRPTDADPRAAVVVNAATGPSASAST